MNISMLKRLFCISVLVILSACGGTTIKLPDAQGGISRSEPILAPAGSGGSGGAPAVTVRDQSFGRILNTVRIGNGSGAVTYDGRLDAAAQAHADDMVARDYFTHLSPEGDDVYDRIVIQGYVPVAWGENMAGGQQSEQAALTAWENSPAHDAMLNAGSLENFGLAVAGSGNGTRWVLVMATEN